MTKMHFEAIAATLKELRPPRDGNHSEAWKAWDLAVEKFTGLCARSYEGRASFDRDRFLKACGMED